ncbi:hypothetical protein J2Z83_003780 [Virgibacillus natechei]|uniref:Uncharacterized protein n=1 Tax=Virgibacillus natechei TaxID=1216297 RepID=A0ABS4IKY4_9BACI|nr:hypothetical protein [Virgibacillus natechei]MBP1971629.1 hypothetical protein [Virgibacillus natechei]UZD13044.1 hypothetical protein OLD84_00245 [Virgibacillus natechei]
MNKFVSKYKDFRNRGYSDLEAFGMVSSYIAVKGSHDDLETVYSYYFDDFMQESNKLFGEELNDDCKRVS